MKMENPTTAYTLTTSVRASENITTRKASLPTAANFTKTDVRASESYLIPTIKSAMKAFGKITKVMAKARHIRVMGTLCMRASL
jgi:hypothetical protein